MSAREHLQETSVIVSHCLLSPIHNNECVYRSCAIGSHRKITRKANVRVLGSVCFQAVTVGKVFFATRMRIVAGVVEEGINLGGDVSSQSRLGRRTRDASDVWDWPCLTCHN